MTNIATPAMMVAALYAGRDAAGRVALDHAWATFRGFDLPEKPGSDDDLGLAPEGRAARDRKGCAE